MKKYKYPLIYLLILCAALAYASEEQFLNLSCRDADIRDVLQGIAIQYGVNIVPDSNVKGNFTIHLQNIPLETGLKTLLETNGFSYEKQGDVYIVHAKETDTRTFQVGFEDGKLRVDAQNTDIIQLLREISRQTGTNIVTESGLSGTITAHLTSVSIDDGIYALLEPNGFIVSEDNGIYSVRNKKVQQRGQGSYTILFKKGKLSILDVKAAPADDVLSDIAAQCKINLAIVGEIRGNVTMRLDNVTLDQAFETLANVTGATYTLLDGIYLFGDPTIKPGQANPLLEQKVIWLKYINAQDLVNSLPGDIPRTSVTISQDRNAIVVIGHRKIVERIESFLKEIDVDNPDIRSRQQMAISVELDDAGLVTIDAKDAPMEMLLREISIKKGIDITILGGSGSDFSSSRTSSRARRTEQARVEQPSQQTTPQAPPTPRLNMQRQSSVYGESVNFRISNATLDEVFSALFKGINYAYKKEMIEGKELYIFGPGELSASGNPLIASKKIDLQYLRASDIMDVLPVTIPDANIVVIEDQNAIIVMGTQSMIDETERYIKAIDLPAPQVMIEALLVELTKGDSKSLGFNWAWGDDKDGNRVEISPGLTATFDSLARVPDRFFATLTAMISENKARILTNPRAVTTSGLKATIKSIWTEYFETTTEIYQGGSTTYPTDIYPATGGYVRRGFNTLDSGITLEITPWVGKSGEITVLIRPEIRDAKQVSKERSTISTRSLDTTVRVKDGENIVIGGLIQRNETSQVSKLPLLGSIPILGNLFKETTKMNNDTELVIVVRPKLIGSSIETEGNADQ